MSRLTLINWLAASVRSWPVDSLSGDKSTADMDYLIYGFKPIEPSTWAYLSSLLMLALFFKFNRFWSIRNLDLVLIILLAPGILMVHYGQTAHENDLLRQQRDKAMSSAAGSNNAVDYRGNPGEQRGAIVSDSNSPGSPNVENGALQVPPALSSPIPLKSVPLSDIKNEDTGVIGEDGGSVGAGQNGLTGVLPQIESAEPGESVPLRSGSVAPGDAESQAESPENTQPLTASQKLKRMGFIWLFAVGSFLLVRLFYDPQLVRKPKLEPNLSIGGTVFLTCSLMIFLFANVLASQPDNLEGPEGASKLFRRNAQQAGEHLRRVGPGFPVVHLIPSIRTVRTDGSVVLKASTTRQELVAVARVMSLLSLVAVVAGLVFVGHFHFGNFQMGIAMAAIFLMLPYTAQFSGDTMHLLPGALLVWAIALYHKPLTAGLFLGLAAGVCYYPLFLLPLWISFYWERGRTRFLAGAFLSIALVISSLVFTSADFAGFLAQLQSIFGFIWPRQEGLGGIWALNWESWFRLPLIAGFVALCVSFIFWPIKKDLATLISCTAAAMVAVQYWHGYQGGLYLAWYMPLVLLVVFRPNLDHKVAIAVIAEKLNRQSEERFESAA